MANDKSTRGNSSRFFVAGELCRRGLVAVITLGNCPNTDILCSNIEGTRFVHIQVKTFVPGNRTCSVGKKAEINYGENFIWVLGGIPKPDQDREFEYFIIPSKDMAKHIAKAHRLWLKTPGKNNRAHRDNPMRNVILPPRVSRGGWDITQFRNRWDLIEDKLKSKR
jgi:hypothetical protein